MENKTFEEILEQVSIKHQVHSFAGAVENFSAWAVKDIAKEAAFLYAKQIAEAACEYQKRTCAENAELKQEQEYIDATIGYAVVSRIDKYSIIEAPVPTEYINNLVK